MFARDDSPTQWVDLNDVQLQQVILNLLLNASDAMSGVEDRPRQLVVRTETDRHERVRLTVQDAGVGLEPEVVGRVFEAFCTTKRGGMGIGLSVSRSIIERHDGCLWATPMTIRARASASPFPSMPRNRPWTPRDVSAALGFAVPVELKGRSG